MAGARDKVQQLGFWDMEVAKPKHDEITLWALENAEVLARRYMAFRGDRVMAEWGAVEGSSWPHARVLKLRNEYPDLGERLPTKRATLVVKRELAAVLREREPEWHPRQVPRNQRTLGYADLLMHCVGEHLGASQLVSGREPPQWTVREEPFRIIVEVKSELPTIGELMRQLNLYRQSCGQVIVVAPDDRYTALLAEQGILFVKYDPTVHGLTRAAN
jgi:hypothetical protein